MRKILREANFQARKSTPRSEEWQQNGLRVVLSPARADVIEAEIIRPKRVRIAYSPRELSEGLSDALTETVSSLP